MILYYISDIIKMFIDFMMNIYKERILKKKLVVIHKKKATIKKKYVMITTEILNDRDVDIYKVAIKYKIIYCIRENI